MRIGAGLFLDAGSPVAEALEVLVMLGIVVHALAFPGIKPNKEQERLTGIPLTGT